MRLHLVDMALRDFGNLFEMTVRDEKGRPFVIEWSLDDAQRIARFTEILIRAEKSDVERF